MSYTGRAIIHGRRSIPMLVTLWFMLPLWAVEQPCASETTAETALLNQLWRDGLAAGNHEDWYRNCDGNHAHIGYSDYPQLNKYPSSLSGYQTFLKDAPRTIIGNASLAMNGTHSLTRSSGHYQVNAMRNYEQYRANQHYLYPAAADINAKGSTLRDPQFAMHPYVTQSVGMSWSELDEVRKFIHTLAAFRPDVKPILEREGLLIPTLQMVFRRSRVATDAEYLSGAAHPTAFDNKANNVAMIKLANAITKTTIPPMVQLKVLDEDFGGKHPTKYRDAYEEEQQFTTPAAIARIYRGIEPRKRMVVSAAGSFDVNGRALSYRWVVLRGDPSLVTITKRNTSGSEVEIVFDYHTTRLTGTGQALEGPQRPSNMVVVGVFVHNGAYYSAPGFITSTSLWNEEREYRDDLLRSIDYHNVSLEPGLSGDRSWQRDEFRHDFNRRLAGWTRFGGRSATPYTPEHCVVVSDDLHGRPGTVVPMRYGYDGGVSATYPATDWRHSATCVYQSRRTPVGTATTVNLGSGSYVALLDPEHGALSLGSTGFTYSPEKGFSGIDVFSVVRYDSANSKATVYRLRMHVGSTDTAAPSIVSGLTLQPGAGAALLRWSHTSDNVEIERYAVYRNGTLLGYSFVDCGYDDTSAIPGQVYNYRVAAVDDAGNQGSLSTITSGGCAGIWGSDDFEDDNLSAADPALSNGLRWLVAEGTARTRDNQLVVGQNHSTPSLVTTDRSIAGPFAIDFRDSQAYVSGDQGLVFGYQNLNNYYKLLITGSRVQLLRRLGGVETVIGTHDGICMQWKASSARYRVAVTPSSGGIEISVTRSDWTVAPHPWTVTWTDSNSTAAKTLGTGAIGFMQEEIGEGNVANYDDVVVWALGSTPAPPPVVTPTIARSTASISVPEGGSASFTVKLSAAPAADVTVTAARSAGDSSITVSGGATRVFTPNNWSTAQTVTLSAATDADTTDGSATISLSASGLSAVTVTATENDTTVATPAPSNDGTAFREIDGLVSIEAEHFHGAAAGSGSAANSTWTLATASSGFSGAGYLEAAPNVGVNVGDSTNGPRRDYRVVFASPGTYYIWLRTFGTSGTDDSVHAGLDGSPASYGGIGISTTSGSWLWNGAAGSSRVTVSVASAGEHVVNLWMREDGTRVDKILLTKDAAFTPSQTGPAESARVGGSSAGAIIVDDLDAGFSRSGSWSQSGAVNEYKHGQPPGAYSDGSQFSRDTGATASWTAKLPAGGSYEVAVWYTDNDYDRDSAARYEVFHDGGSSSVVLDQDVASGSWVSLGIFPFSAGSGRVVLTRTVSDGSSTSADAVRWTPAGDAIIVDDLDPGFGRSGSWSQSGAVNEYKHGLPPGAYSNGSQFTKDSGATASWTPDLPASGSYEVAIWYTDNNYDRDGAARYEVFHDGGSSRVVLDQDIDSGTWVSLGIFPCSAGTGRVVLTRTVSDGTSTSADAVRWVAVGIASNG